LEECIYQAQTTIAFTTMISQKKNKWREKNEAKLLKLYDTKPNNSQDKNPSGVSQNGGQIRSRG
jgi:hypothetical protein